MDQAPTPVHDLQVRLEAARLESVKALAALTMPITDVPPDIIRHLVDLQVLLMAVREEIGLHSQQLWGNIPTPLD